MANWHHYNENSGSFWRITLVGIVFLLIVSGIERTTIAAEHIPGARVGSLDHGLSERSIRGKSVTESVSQLTGTAVNPLFGITAIGMYRYFTTPLELRDQLPFYDQPYVWGVMLLIILVMFFNSTICETMPFLKIPLNALGDLVNKGGACIVLPVALHEFAQAFAPTAAHTLATISDCVFPAVYAAEGAGTAGSDWLALGWIASLFVGTFAYAVVWVVWNVTDVIIFILPIPFLDAVLKSFRLGMQSLMFGVTALNPWLGLVVSLIMILVCWRLAGWAFRLSVMGFVFTTDFLLWRKSGTIDFPVRIPAFVTATAAKRWKLPARQYGHLRCELGGTLYFVWHPWLVGSKRETNLGYSSHYQGGVALLYLMVLDGTGESVLFRLPPRYRHDSQRVAEALGLCGCRDVSVLRGLWKSIKQLWGTGTIADFAGG